LDIQAEQHDRGQAYQELYEAVVDLKRRHDLHPCSVRPRDGLALRRDSERELVQDLVARFRKLPAEQRRRLPALLNSLAQLEVVVGDLEAGQNDFAEVARVVADPISRAEAHHNIYFAALERRDYGPALEALRNAVALDPDVFEPFPFSAYEPKRILGADAFGTSVLCQEQAAGVSVVVQAIRADSLDRTPDALFEEASVVRDVDHPAVLRVRANGRVGGTAGRHYVVTEHFDGRTLAEQVAEHGPFAPEEWLEVSWPLARALQALHGRHVLHRNLRPAAVLLRRGRDADSARRWQVKLLDTGFVLKRALIHAAASNPEAQLHTALGRCVARAIPYLPSEVVGRPKGHVWVGPHSDVYGFGRLCAFALTGRPNPDRGDLVLLPEAWRRLLDDCCAWVQGRRLPHFGVVLETLAALPGADDLIGRVERAMYDSTIADHSAAVAANPARVEAWVNRGNAYARQGNLAGAISDFTEAIKQRPREASLYRSRGLVHARNGDLDRAIADYTESLRLAPRVVEALANRGLAYSQKNDYDRALTDFTEALSLTPHDEALLFNRGNAHLSRGDFGRAVADYSEAIRLDPKNVWALANRGKALALSGEHARAVADLTRVLQLDPGNVRALCDRATAQAVLGRHDRALADLSDALGLAPSPALYYERGRVHAGAGDPDAAVADFNEALTHDATHVPALMGRGNAHFDAGRLEEALADYTEVIRLQPGSATAYYNRGNVRARRGEHEPAVADYTEAIRLDATNVAAYFNRANSHAELGDHDRAVADYTEAIRLDPSDAAAFTNRGNANSNLGDLEAALADYGRALAIEPTDADTACNRANTYARMGDAERAVEAYSEVIRLDPKHARAYNGRGAMLAGRGEAERAIADFSEAIRLQPGLARAWNNRGNAYADCGEHELAVADFTEAIRLESGYESAHYNRGVAHADLGRWPEAIADFTEAVRLQPGHAAAWNNRGNARLRVGDLDGALADFSAAVAADSDFALSYFNRANLYCERGELAAALADYDKALALDRDDVGGYLNRGKVHTQRGDHARALADNLEALKLAPEDVRVLNNLAWLWATCPQPELRDPPRALEFARRACAQSDSPDAGHLDTLAAACAANGDFAAAVRWQRQALKLAPEEERAGYRTRLELYEAGRAYLQAAGS
jgi:tetratricopeptide (TPR) repeat protein